MSSWPSMTRRDDYSYVTLPDFRDLPVEAFLAKYEAAAASAEAQLRHQGAAS
jgi:hypothetical protein